MSIQYYCNGETAGLVPLAFVRCISYTDGANLNIAQMNALGEQGWEMVSFVSCGKDLYYIFKRPKQ